MGEATGVSLSGNGHRSCTFSDLDRLRHQNIYYAVNCSSVIPLNIGGIRVNAINV